MYVYAGIKNRKSSGYESLVEAATEVSRNFSPVKQHELVIQALKKAFPKPILSMASPSTLFTIFLFVNCCLKLKNNIIQ